VSIVDFGVAGTVLVALMMWYGVTPTPVILLLPVIVAVHIGFTTAVSLVVAMGNVFYRDVKYLFDVVLTIWMFATAVVYPLDRIEGHLGQALRLNPMTPIIEAYRAVLLRGELPPVAPFAACALMTAVFLTMSWLVFHRAEFRFAENV
jgi:ABC-type polysaccharide/polyol phosphate export permease